MYSTSIGEVYSIIDTAREGKGFCYRLYQLLSLEEDMKKRMRKMKKVKDKERGKNK
jgi:hypothetical protein